MCEPLTIATAALVISAGTQVAGAIVGNNAENKERKENTRAANEAATLQQNDLSARSAEETDAANQAIQQGKLQAQSAAAQARISALSAGVAGNSVDAVLGDIAGQEGRFNDSVNQNLDMTLNQITRQRRGVEAERVARINSKPGANPWVTGLKIAGSLVSLVGSTQAGKPK